VIAGADPWLQCPRPNEGAAVRLVCFPHAGGSASFFRDWGEHLADVEVLAVRYPGRGERIDERPADDLCELAAAIAAAMAPLADRPLALFGHSMGAPIALETARSLEASGTPVMHLFASGSSDGELPPSEAPHDTDDAVEIAQLIELGGIDPELADDQLFQELVLPYIRADAGMFHAYAMHSEPRLRCDVTTIVGDRDQQFDRRPWRMLTTGSFRNCGVRGDHFYLTTDPPYGLLREQLDLDRISRRLP
jgi:surfactin synthase thioesterase subunit